MKYRYVEVTHTMGVYVLMAMGKIPKDEKHVNDFVNVSQVLEAYEGPDLKKVRRGTWRMRIKCRPDQQKGRKEQRIRIVKDVLRDHCAPAARRVQNRASRHFHPLFRKLVPIEVECLLLITIR